MKVLRVTLATMMLAAFLGVAGWSELTASGALVPGQPGRRNRTGAPGRTASRCGSPISPIRVRATAARLIYEGARLSRKAPENAQPSFGSISARRSRHSAGGDGPEPRAAAHDRVQQRAHARGPLVRRQRPRRHFRRRVAHPAAVFPDHRRQHRNPSGACGLPGAGRLLHPGREPERQTARAHRHELRDQHLYAQPRRHAGPGDVHHAQRQAVRGPGLRPINWPICPLVDSSSTYGFVTLARRRTLRGQRNDHADVHRRRVRQGDGERQRVRRHPGSRAHVHQLRRQSRERSSGDPHHPALYGFDVYRFPLSGYSASNAPNSPAPALVLCKTGMSDSHGPLPSTTAICG